MTAPHPKNGQSLPFGALAYPGFRLYLAGQGMSYIGDWMQNLAGSWLVTKVAGSAALIASITSVALIPMLVLILAGGMAADRLDRAKVLLVTQLILGAATLLAAMVVHLNMLSLPLLCAWYLLIGAIMSFNAPARQSLLADIVPAEHLSSAVSLRGTIWHSSELIGAALAAALLSVGSISWILFANALTFLPLIFILRRLRPIHAAKAPRTVGWSLRDGLSYAWGTREVRLLLATIGLLAVWIVPLTNMFLSIYIRRTLSGTERDLSVVMAGCGAGALLGYLTLGWVPLQRQALVIHLASVAVAGAVWGLSLAGTLPVAVALFFLLSLAAGLLLGCATSMLQQIVPAERLGRVTALSEFMLLGLMPLAGIALGALIDGIGMQFTLRLDSAAFLALALVLAVGSRRPALRPKDQLPAASIADS